MVIDGDTPSVCVFAALLGEVAGLLACSLGCLGGSLVCFCLFAEVAGLHVHTVIRRLYGSFTCWVVAVLLGSSVVPVNELVCCRAGFAGLLRCTVSR